MQPSVHFFVIFTCTIYAINAMDNPDEKNIQLLQRPNKEINVPGILVTRDAEKQGQFLNFKQDIASFKQACLQSQEKLKTMRTELNDYSYVLANTHKQLLENLNKTICLQETIQAKLLHIDECILDQQEHLAQLEELLLEQEEQELAQ